LGYKEISKVQPLLHWLPLRLSLLRLALLRLALLRLALLRLALMRLALLRLALLRMALGLILELISLFLPKAKIFLLLRAYC
jgi:hypothetical protein